MKVRTQMFCLCAPEACRQMSASDVSAEVFCLFWTSSLGAFLAGRSRLGATEEARKGLKSPFIIIQELAMPLKSWLHRLCGFSTFSEVSWQMLSFFLEIWQNSAAHWAVGFCIWVQNRAKQKKVHQQYSSSDKQAEDRVGASPIHHSVDSVWCWMSELSRRVSSLCEQDIHIWETQSQTWFSPPAGKRLWWLQSCVKGQAGT